MLAGPTRQIINACNVDRGRVYVAGIGWVDSSGSCVSQALFAKPSCFSENAAEKKGGARL